MSSNGNVDEIIAQLKQCETIKEADVQFLCNKAQELLSADANVQRVDTPVTVRTHDAHVVGWFSLCTCVYTPGARVTVSDI